jgi:hypothetical protein
MASYVIHYNDIKILSTFEEKFKGGRTLCSFNVVVVWQTVLFPGVELVNYEQECLPVDLNIDHSGCLPMDLLAGYYADCPLGGLNVDDHPGCLPMDLLAGYYADCLPRVLIVDDHLERLPMDLIAGYYVDCLPGVLNEGYYAERLPEGVNVDDYSDGLSVEQ